MTRAGVRRGGAHPRRTPPCRLAPGCGPARGLPTMTSTSLAGRVDAFRALRAQAEASILPLATSLDGRRFSFQARIEGLDLRLGGYVMIEGDGRATLGQVRSLATAEADLGEIGLPGDDEAEVRTRLRIRLARGDGVILGGGAAPVPRSPGRARRPRRRSGRGRRRWRPHGRASRWGACRSPATRRCAWTPAASTATPSCAGSPARARATRSAWCSSSCCSRRTCGS